jgi:hypothetical protein
MKLTTHPLLVLRLGMGGTISLLNLCAFMACTKISLLLPEPVFLIHSAQKPLVSNYYARFEVIRFVLLKIQGF